MSESLGRHVAVVVKSVDSDGLPYFIYTYDLTADGRGHVHTDERQFITLENVQDWVEGDYPGARIAWVHNSELDTWSAFVLRPAEPVDPTVTRADLENFYYPHDQ